MNNLRAIALGVLSASLVLTSTACHNNNPAPVYNNAVAPTPVPLSVHGQVRDGATSLAVTGATVRITRTNGVVLATLTTDATGSFSFDVSGVTDTQLNLSATATGYGYGSTVAILDAANNTASVPELTLSALTATAVDATAGGTTGSTASSGEAETSTPITVTIPAGAVTTATPLTLSALPVHQVPLIPNADTEALMGAFDVGPANTAFASNAQVTLPLPATLTAGSLLKVLRLDSATGQWVLLTQSAVVSVDGLSATVGVATGGTFGLTLPGITSVVTATSHIAAPFELNVAVPAEGKAPEALIAAPPAPPAPVSLTSGSTTVSGVDIWGYTLTQTGTLPFKQTFINNWLSALSRVLVQSTKTVSTVVVFPNLRTLGLVDSAGRQIPPAGGVVPGRYTYVVTFAYTTKPVLSITLAGGPPRFPSAWSLTATESHTYLTQTGVLKWGAFTGVTGGA